MTSEEIVKILDSFGIEGLKSGPSPNIIELHRGQDILDIKFNDGLESVQDVHEAVSLLLRQADRLALVPA